MKHETGRLGSRHHTSLPRQCRRLHSSSSQLASALGNTASRALTGPSLRCSGLRHRSRALWSADRSSSCWMDDCCAHTAWHIRGSAHVQCQPVSKTGCQAFICSLLRGRPLVHTWPLEARPAPPPAQLRWQRHTTTSRCPSLELRRYLQTHGSLCNHAQPRSTSVERARAPQTSWRVFFWISFSLHHSYGPVLLGVGEGSGEPP